MSFACELVRGELLLLSTGNLQQLMFDIER
jgi:hypothetical protein